MDTPPRKRWPPTARSSSRSDQIGSDYTAQGDETKWIQRPSKWISIISVSRVVSCWSTIHLPRTPTARQLIDLSMTSNIELFLDNALIVQCLPFPWTGLVRAVSKPLNSYLNEIKGIKLVCKLPGTHKAKSRCERCCKALYFQPLMIPSAENTFLVRKGWNSGMAYWESTAS